MQEVSVAFKKMHIHPKRAEKEFCKEWGRRLFHLFSAGRVEPFIFNLSLYQQPYKPNKACYFIFRAKGAFSYLGSGGV